MFDNFEKKIINKKSFPELIYGQIIDSIKNGTLHPGDLLPTESDFVEQFHVGRTSVREAMAALEYLNVIVFHNGRYYVNQNVQEFFKKKLLYHYAVSDDYRSDIFSVRKMLEMQFATLAAQRATINDLKYMYQILASISARLRVGNAAVEGDDAAEETLNLYISFHRALAVATHNNLLVLIFDRFKDLMFFVTDDIDIPLADYQSVLQIAKKLVKEIDERDCIKAIETMEQYLDAVQPIYLCGTKE